DVGVREVAELGLPVVALEGEEDRAEDRGVVEAHRLRDGLDVLGVDRDSGLCRLASLRPRRTHWPSHLAVALAFLLLLLERRARGLSLGAIEAAVLVGVVVREDLPIA